MRRALLVLVLLLAGCVGTVNMNFCGPQDELADIFKSKEHQ